MTEESDFFSLVFKIKIKSKFYFKISCEKEPLWKLINVELKNGEIFVLIFIQWLYKNDISSVYVKKQWTKSDWTHTNISEK